MMKHKKTKNFHLTIIFGMRTLLLFGSVLLFAYCETDPLADIVVDASTNPQKSTKPEVKARSLEGAIYNEVMDIWMISKKDPYALENFQKTYDELATSLEKLSTSANKRIEATHLAIKIFTTN